MNSALQKTKVALNKTWKKIFLSRKDLPFYSGYTYYYLLRAALVASLGSGAYVLMGLMLRKALGASAWYMALHSTLVFSMFLFGPFWQRYLRGRSGHRILLAFGAVGYAPLLFIGVIGNNTVYFIFASFMPVFASAAFMPIRNSILAHNLADSERGRILGHSLAYGVVVAAVVSFACSNGMDVYPNLYRIILPLVGVTGFLSYAIYGRINLRKFTPEVAVRKIDGRRESAFSAFGKSFRDIFDLLKTNPGFRKFERNFFIYGMGFIMCEPVVLIFVDRMETSYAQAAMALVIIPPLMNILFYPLWGRMIDRLGPIRTAALAYGILVTWALTMVALVLVDASDTLKAYALLLLYVGYIVKGIAMSGIDIVWNLGALEFAGKTKPGQKGQPGAVSRFMSVHIFIAGLRGLIAPSLGVGLLVVFGAHVSFGVASVFFALACMLMLRLNSQTKKMLAQG